MIQIRTSDLKFFATSPVGTVASTEARFDFFLGTRCAALRWTGSALTAATDDLHMFMRVTALLMVTMLVLICGHLAEIGVWATYYGWAGIQTSKASAFEFAFENYTALGYGDEVPLGEHRLIGPITALNGLLLIGWSVAIIFEVMRMADVQIARRKPSPD